MKFLIEIATDSPFENKHIYKNSHTEVVLWLLQNKPTGYRVYTEVTDMYSTDLWENWEESLNRAFAPKELKQPSKNSDLEDIL